MLEILGECVGTPFPFYVHDVDYPNHKYRTLAAFGSLEDATLFVLAKEREEEVRKPSLTLEEIKAMRLRLLEEIEKRGLLIRGGESKETDDVIAITGRPSSLGKMNPLAICACGNPKVNSDYCADCQMVMDSVHDDR